MSIQGEEVQMALLVFQGDGQCSTPLIAAPQTLTASWSNLGQYEIPVDLIQDLNVFFDLEINDSKKVRMRLTGKTKCGETQSFILHAATGKLSFNDEYIEFVDESAAQDARFQIKKGIAIVQVQVMAFIPGINPGRILSAKVSLTK